MLAGENRWVWLASQTSGCGTIVNYVHSNSLKLKRLGFLDVCLNHTFGL